MKLVHTCLYKLILPPGSDLYFPKYGKYRSLSQGIGLNMEWNGIVLEWNGMEWIGMEWNVMEFYHEFLERTILYLSPTSSH